MTREAVTGPPEPQLLSLHPTSASPPQPEGALQTESTVSNVVAASHVDARYWVLQFRTTAYQTSLPALQATGSGPTVAPTFDPRTGMPSVMLIAPPHVSFVTWPGRSTHPSANRTISSRFTAPLPRRAGSSRWGRSPPEAGRGRPRRPAGPREGR